MRVSPCHNGGGCKKSWRSAEGLADTAWQNGPTAGETRRCSLAQSERASSGWVESQVCHGLQLQSLWIIPTAAVS